MITGGFYEYEDVNGTTSYSRYQTPTWLQGTTHDILNMLITWEQYFDDDDDDIEEEIVINVGKGGHYTYENTVTGANYGVYQEFELFQVDLPKCFYTVDEIEIFGIDFAEDAPDEIMSDYRCTMTPCFDMVDIWKGGFYDYIITEDGFIYREVVTLESVEIEIDLSPQDYILCDYYLDDYVCESLSSGFWPEDLE